LRRWKRNRAWQSVAGDEKTESLVEFHTIM